jgi:hypothetical protein
LEDPKLEYRNPKQIRRLNAKKKRPSVDGRPLVRSERDRWQGSTAGGGRAAIGAPVAAESTSAWPIVAAVTLLALIASVATLVASVATRVAGLLAAGLTIARSALVALEVVAASSAAMPAAAIGAVLVGLAVARSLGPGFSLWRFCRRDSKELLDPAKHASRLLWRIRHGCRSRAVLASVATVCLTL